MLKKISLLFFILILSGCGGFYTLRQVDEKKLANPLPPHDTKYEYTEGRIYINTDAIHSEVFRSKRIGGLTHLIVTATFNYAGAEKKIPLYFFNLEDGRIDKTTGDKLLSMIPLVSDGKFEGTIKLETYAFEKGSADVAELVWDFTTTALSAYDGGLVSNKLFTEVTSIIDDRLNKIKPYDYSISSPVPAKLPQNGVISSQIFLIIPTNSKGIIDDKTLGQIEDEKLELIRDRNDVPKLESNNIAYNEFPYIIIDYQGKKRLKNENLIGNRCIADNTETKSAKEHINEFGHFYSANQKTEEKKLIELAENYLILKKEYANNQFGKAIDTYEALKKETAVLKDNKFIGVRALKINQCAKNYVENISGWDTISKALDGLKLNITNIENDELKLKNALKIFARFKQMQETKGFEFTKTSKTTQQINNKATEIELTLFTNFYSSKVLKLNNAALPRNIKKTLKAELEKNQAQLLDCNLCEKKITRAIKDYQIEINASTREQAKTAALGDAGNTRSALLATANIFPIGNNRDRLKSLADDIDNLINALIKSTSTNNINRLQQGIARGHDLLESLEPKRVFNIILSIKNENGVINADGNIKVGKTFKVGIDLRDEENQELTGRLVTWLIERQEVAVIESSYPSEVLIKSLKPGVTSLTARSEGSSSKLELRFEKEHVHSLQIVNTDSIGVNKSIQLNVKALSESGEELAGRQIKWSSSRPAFVSVDEKGMITGHIVNQSAKITASSEDESVSSSVNIKVNEVPVGKIKVEILPEINSIKVSEEVQLIVTPKDNDGLTLAGRTINITTSPSSIAFYDSTQKTIKGLSEGTVIIKAESEGITERFELRILPIELTEIKIKLENDSINIGETTQIECYGITRENKEILLGNCTWEVSDETVVSNPEAGKIEGLSNGSAVITAYKNQYYFKTSIDVKDDKVAILQRD